MIKKKAKSIVLILVAASVIITFFSVEIVSRDAFTFFKRNILNETFVHTSSRLLNVTPTKNLLTKSRIESIRKIYGHSWDEVITPYAAKYVIDGRNICNALSPPSLLIFVLSLPKNTEERQAIRRTWGSVASRGKYTFNISTKLAFMLGRMANEIVFDNLVYNESALYEDIVQIDFMESRYNLTRKMMHGLGWIKTFCGSVSYILKADDDTFTNVATMFNYLLTDSNINNKTIHGHLYRNGGHVLRTGKYAVKKDELPSSRYPPYVSGTAYIMPYDAISDMLDLAERLPYCPVDDAFMTGVLRVILDIKIQHSEYFTDMFERKINPCKFYSKIAVTNINTKCMYLLWNLTTHVGVRDCKQPKLYDKNICSIFG
ncbi:hypothetical protein CHS0354_039037 [Potamilus streckersoni]|uniref:Hexosyltransferase n=1 Tax=Potamilus streckersoni TaxID=2493646 RepID=A0AAE0RRT3_9BIVA|nr:hypothetical protein CHS0354_039037 [Potamilus streckersoni]